MIFRDQSELIHITNLPRRIVQASVKEFKKQGLIIGKNSLDDMRKKSTILQMLNRYRIYGQSKMHAELVVTPYVLTIFLLSVFFDFILFF